MKIKLSDHFTYGRLLRFTLPSVVMMVIASIYSVVDGLFVSSGPSASCWGRGAARSWPAHWERAAGSWLSGTSP